MKTVRIKKSQLVEILTQNRDNHRKLFNDAFEGYRKECMEILAENLDALRRGEQRRVKFYEQAPEDHTPDYDTVLRMLDMSVDDVVELDQRSFAQYVEDDWGWRENWSSSNSKYLRR